MENFTKRVDYIDGFRGLAILMVVLFHSYSRWPAIVPYGYRFADFFLFKYGYLGVQLFFMISGFVILMTLEKCRSIVHFLMKRWLRLFPAMLIVTVLVYFTATMLPERPAGEPPIQNIFPGLLFIRPDILSSIINSPVDNLEGSFWSLYIEVAFYIIFGILYFIAGERKATWGIFLVFLFSFSNTFLSAIFEYESPLIYKINNIIQPVQFVWFTAGGFAFLYSKGKKISDLWISIAITFMGCLWYYYNVNLQTFMAMSLIAAIFLFTVYSERLKVLFSFKPLLLVGFVSYPFYLIHENALIALTIKLGRFFPNIPDFIMPLIPATFLFGIAYIIARYIEPLIRHCWLSMLQRARVIKND